MTEETTDSARSSDDHDEIQGLFSEYYEQTLSADARERVVQHLEDCDSCRAEYDDFTKTVQALGVMHKMSAPQQFEQQVEGTIHRRSGGRFFGRKAFGDRVPFELLALIALVLGLVVFVLLYLSQTGSLRYERERSTPDAAPGARDVIPRPDLDQR